MNNNINIAVVGLGQVGNYLLNELKNKKKEIKLLTGKDINVVAISAKNINKKRKFKINKKIFVVRVMIEEMRIKSINIFIFVSKFGIKYKWYKARANNTITKMFIRFKR